MLISLLFQALYAAHRYDPSKLNGTSLESLVGTSYGPDSGVDPSVFVMNTCTNPPVESTYFKKVSRNITTDPELTVGDVIGSSSKTWYGAVEWDWIGYYLGKDSNGIMQLAMYDSKNKRQVVQYRMCTSGCRADSSLIYRLLE
ncbi:hypothetical protein BLNAU_1000 [Blattamonas nauphoetae]|uniref:Uncharacterized protein n=1 Tax=Blattamonas nauphoetae TaxID=2049346 RepID=A0ABQ9YJL6_9EUKA|nr:hypothetical protein BLNAU_1000 [Blattamonas nauphoetae]